MVADAEFTQAIEDIRKAGERAGAAAGGWIADGNTSEDTLRRILKQWDDGDPAAPSAPYPFSGEWAGDPTVEDVVRNETELDSDSLTPEELDDLASEYEDAYALAWQTEAERTVRGFLGNG